MRPRGARLGDPVRKRGLPPAGQQKSEFVPGEFALRRQRFGDIADRVNLAVRVAPQERQHQRLETGDGDEIRALEATELGLPDGERKAPIVGRSNEGKPGTRKTRFGKSQKKWGK